MSYERINFILDVLKIEVDCEQKKKNLKNVIKNRVFFSLFFILIMEWGC